MRLSRSDLSLIRVLHIFIDDLGVAHHAERLVAHVLLNCPNVVTTLERIDHVTVTKGVGRDAVAFSTHLVLHHDFLDARVAPCVNVERRYLERREG